MVVHNALCAIDDQLQTTAALDEMRTGSCTPGQSITVLYTLWLSGYDVLYVSITRAHSLACMLADNEQSIEKRLFHISRLRYLLRINLG